MSSGPIGDDHRMFLDATLPYLDVVYRIARHAGADAWAAEDLVQETYLRAFAHFDQHRGGDTRAWLAAICLNVARSEARRRRRRPAEVPETEAEQLAGEPEEVIDHVLASLDRDAIEAGLARLPEQQRVCILLMDVAGYTARQAAQIVGCPRGTVLARVHRGRRRLAGLLTGYLLDGEVDRGGT
jgi:RNA polymerase sigma-70 factor (ECF subfamily)